MGVQEIFGRIDENIFTATFDRLIRKSLIAKRYLALPRFFRDHVDHSAQQRWPVPSRVRPVAALWTLASHLQPEQPATMSPESS
jgi:hypothetical protein